MTVLIRLLRQRAKVVAMLTAMALMACPVAAQRYLQTNLVSDIPGLAKIHDPLLVNPWGISFSATSPFWVSNQGTGTSTLYAHNAATGVFSKVALTVTIPPAPGGTTGSPTGQVFNGSTDFVISTAPARFIFAGTDGTISGWHGGLGTNAALTVDNSASGASYTGLAIGSNASGNFLYAANIAQGRIDVFDKNFAAVTLPGNFTDPTLPAGAAPFNIQNLGGKLYVTYVGPGGGFVSVFDTNGHFLQRIASGGTLLNPWGIALAPDNFGAFGGALLVGNFNFGDPGLGPGYIGAYDPDTGDFLGLLKNRKGSPLSIDGLWGLAFGIGGNNGFRDHLYFAAGIDGERHGLFGHITAVPEPSTLALLGSGLLSALVVLRRRRS